MNKLLLLVPLLMLASVPGRADTNSWASQDEAAGIVAKIRSRVPPFLAIGRHTSVAFGRSDFANERMQRACREAGPDYAPSGRSYSVRELWGYTAVQLCAPAVRSPEFAYELLVGKGTRRDESAANADWKTQCAAMKGTLKGEPLSVEDNEKGWRYFGICEYKPN